VILQVHETANYTSIQEFQIKHMVLGWVSIPETLTDRTSVTERTGMYSQRVSGMLTHPKASKKNPPAPKAVTQQILDNSCEPERLRAAHPCALSRSTVHPVHKTLTDRTSVTERTRMYSQRVSGVPTHPKASKKNPFGTRAPGALSRSAVHPAHKRVSVGFTHPDAHPKNPLRITE